MTQKKQIIAGIIIGITILSLIVNGYFLIQKGLDKIKQDAKNEVATKVRDSVLSDIITIIIQKGELSIPYKDQNKQDQELILIPKNSIIKPLEKNEE